jgi:hypothetical protein
MVARFRFVNPELSGEFELPEWQDLYTGSRAEVAWSRSSADGGVIVAAVWRGVGVWERGSDRLRWWCDPATGYPLRSGETLLVSEYKNHRLVRYAWPQMTVLDEVAYPRSTRYDGGVEELVVSPSERLVVGWFNDGQGRNGYQVFALDGPLRPLSHREPDANPCTLRPMYAMPVFSPQERLVACAPGARYGVPRWWQPAYEDWPADCGGQQRQARA